MLNSINKLNAFGFAYPQQSFLRESWLDRSGRLISRPFNHWKYSNKASFKKFINKVNLEAKKIDKMSIDDPMLAIEIAQLREKLTIKKLTDTQLLSKSFALIRLISGHQLGMRHHDVQLIGGLALLQGVVAEMETGEGKTLTATLAAGTAALAGLPVHVITVNNYLAERDAETTLPIYQTLGLSVGVIKEGMTTSERQQNYACDIVYCSNKEIAFDFLKDRIALGDKQSKIRQQLRRLNDSKTSPAKLILRGLYFAIVDEADSIMIDEARIPLIISAANSNKDELEVYQQTLLFAKQLSRNVDFNVFERERYVQLNTVGYGKIARLTEDLTGIWKRAKHRETLFMQALSALYLYQKDQHYLVRDGKVEIIDTYTGRVMADRSWEFGLHQMIETKEGCELTGHRETLARTSYQRFLTRYIHLAGMTGTAKEVRAELWRVYRLHVVSIPTFKPVQRQYLSASIHKNVESKWDYVLKRVVTVRDQNRPVLVGTRSVQASEQLSELLKQQGVAHQVLNARQEKEEADIIRSAGEHGSVMIATNMAGRGTDIKLAQGVAEKGGLHVILTELHESKRIDRQLIGRCARQGDRGSYEYILSINDEIFLTHAKMYYLLANFLILLRFPRRQWLLFLLMRLGQHFAERFYFRQRTTLINMDEKINTSLAFSGNDE